MQSIFPALISTPHNIPSLCCCMTSAISDICGIYLLMSDIYLICMRFVTRSISCVLFNCPADRCSTTPESDLSQELLRHPRYGNLYNCRAGMESSEEAYVATSLSSAFLWDLDYRTLLCNYHLLFYFSINQYITNYNVYVLINRSSHIFAEHFVCTFYAILAPKNSSKMDLLEMFLQLHEPLNDSFLVTQSI